MRRQSTRQLLASFVVVSGIVLQAPPAVAIGVFLSGFSSSSSSSNAPTGTQHMAQCFLGKIPGDTWSGRYAAADDAVAKIKAAKAADPDEPVILVGHSYGADSVIDVVNALAECDIWVDLLIQIDSVGVGDEVLPSNVANGVNIWSTSGDGINGASNVEGSTNIGVDNTTHTDIDEKDTDVSGSSDDPGYEGKNAADIVEASIDAVPAVGCTGPVEPEDCSTPSDESYNDAERQLYEKLDRASFCLATQGSQIENYVDSHSGLMAQIEQARRTCDATTLAALLPDFQEFAADAQGVLNCSLAPPGFVASPFLTLEAGVPIPAMSRRGVGVLITCVVLLALASLRRGLV